MSKYHFGLLSLVIAVSPATAQRIPGYDMPSSIYRDPGLEHQSGAREPTVCLIRKSNHVRECRSMDEWRKIAQEMEQSRQFAGHSRS